MEIRSDEEIAVVRSVYPPLGRVGVGSRGLMKSVLGLGEVGRAKLDEREGNLSLKGEMGSEVSHAGLIS